MKYIIALVLFAVLFHGSAFSACRLFSVSSRSSIAVEREPVVQADRVDIVATDDSSGRPVSPFRIIGYDKDSKVMFDKVFVRGDAATNELVNALSEVGLSPTKVIDELVIRDRFYILSAKKFHGEFLVGVFDMSTQVGETLTSLACSNRQVQASVSVNWPKTDEDRQFYYQRELQTPNLLLFRGGGSAGEGMAAFEWGNLSEGNKLLDTLCSFALERRP